MKALRFTLYKIGGWIGRSGLFQALFMVGLLYIGLCVWAVESIKEGFAALKKEYAEFMVENSEVTRQ